MKRYIILCVTVITALVAYAQKDYYNQIASMEYRQWKFTPRSYYYSWDYKRVLGIKIPIPGLGIHDNGPAGIGIGGDNYVNESWRQMTPLRAITVSQSLLSSRQTDNEKDKWQDIQVKDALVFTDRSTNLPVVGAVAVTGDERVEISQSILDLLFKIYQADKDNKYQKVIEDYRMQYDAIREEVSIIGSSHEDNSKRLRMLQDCNNRLMKLEDEIATMYVIVRNTEEPGLKQMAKLYPTSFRYKNK